MLAVGEIHQEVPAEQFLELVAHEAARCRVGVHVGPVLRPAYHHAVQRLLEQGDDPAQAEPGDAVLGQRPGLVTSRGSRGRTALAGRFGDAGLMTSGCHRRRPAAGAGLAE